MANEQGGSSSLPLRLFLLGLALVFVGFVVIVASALFGDDGTVSVGGVIYVGPIPIIAGAGPDALLAIILAAALTVIGFVVFFWMRRQFSRS